MADKISVIVPIFKVQEYLDRCIESIVHQTYQNLEIILVDDGSPDNCPTLCDRWAQKDKRIRVIHKQNGGLSDARNAGMAVASGEYVGFVDSDDWIALDFYEVLMNGILENDAQISASDVVLAFEDRLERKKKYEQTVFSPKEALETLLCGDGFHATAWNKLYRADLIRKYPYPVGKLHEDEFVTYRVISDAKKLVLCQNTAYYYRQRSGSIMSSTSEKHLDAVDAYLERLYFLHEKYPDLYAREKPYFCAMLVGYYKGTFGLPKESARKMQKRLMEYRKEVHYSFVEWCTYPVKQKLYVVCSRIGMHFFTSLLVRRR